MTVLCHQQYPRLIDFQPIKIERLMISPCKLVTKTWFIFVSIKRVNCCYKVDFPSKHAKKMNLNLDVFDKTLMVPYNLLIFDNGPLDDRKQFISVIFLSLIPGSLYTIYLIWFAHCVHHCNYSVGVLPASPIRRESLAWSYCASGFDRVSAHRSRNDAPTVREHSFNW